MACFEEAEMAGDRVLILSLDGGTWRVLRPLAERGVMPFVRWMTGRGCCSALQSTIPPVTAPAWTSYLTSVFPSRHLTYDFQAFDRQEGRLKFLPDTSALPTGWDHLEALGEPYCSVGVPMMYPPGRRDHGVVVCGLDAPRVEAAFGSEEVRRLAGPDYELTVQIQSHRSDGAFLRHAARVEERRGELTMKLAERYPWRILHHQVQATDVVQHRLWHAVERCLQQSEPSVEEFYRRTDGVLQRIYEKCRPRSCLLISDHGFRRLRKAVTLNRWLLQRGYLKRSSGFNPLGPLLSLARKLDVFDLRRLLFGRRRLWTHLLASAHLGGFDLDDSVAFVGNGCMFGHLFLGGRASPERVSRLLAELEALEDPDDGGGVIAQILSHRDAYGTPPGRYGPDYFLVPAEGYQFCDAALFPHWLRAIGPGDVKFGTGSHEGKGIFCLVSSRKVRLVREPHIVDVFPTALRLAALPAMRGVDGSSCIEMEGEASHLTAAEAEPLAAVRRLKGRKFDAEDERKVAERLKGLGYF